MRPEAPSLSPSCLDLAHLLGWALEQFGWARAQWILQLRALGACEVPKRVKGRGAHLLSYAPPVPPDRCSWASFLPSTNPRTMPREGRFYTCNIHPHMFTRIQLFQELGRGYLVEKCLSRESWMIRLSSMTLKRSGEKITSIDREWLVNHCSRGYDNGANARWSEKKKLISSCLKDVSDE